MQTLIWLPMSSPVWSTLFAQAYLSENFGSLRYTIGYELFKLKENLTAIEKSKIFF